MRARCLWLTKGLGRGGVERLIADLLPLMSDEFEIDVAYVLPWKDLHHALIEERGFTVHCLGEGTRSSPRWVARLRNILQQQRYDIVHSHAPVPGSAARILAPRGTALVHTEHNLWQRYRTPTRVLNSVTYHRNHAAIAVSHSVAESIRPLWRRRATEVHTIHHGTVLSSIKPRRDEDRSKCRQAAGLPADDFLIGNVGNLTPKKDHYNLLKALEGPGPISHAHLTIIGDGPLGDELVTSAADRGLSDRVTFLGSRDDVFDLLGLFDVFCLSSRFEGFPIALVEAMATGLPCVATSAGGTSEILIDGSNGLLVPTEDHLMLREALERLITDPLLASRLGNAAAVDSQKLDLQRAADELGQLYRTALDTA